MGEGVVVDVVGVVEGLDVSSSSSNTHGMSDEVCKLRHDDEGDDEADDDDDDDA